MTMSININEHEVADAIWRGDLNLPDIVCQLARERTADGDEASLLSDFSEIGQTLVSTGWTPAFHPFGVALERIAKDHKEQLLKGDQA